MADFLQLPLVEKFDLLCQADRQFNHVPLLGRYALLALGQWERLARQLTPDAPEPSEQYWRLRSCRQWDHLVSLVRGLASDSPLHDALLVLWSQIFARYEWTPELDQEVQRLRDNPEWQAAWHRRCQVEAALEVSRHTGWSLQDSLAKIQAL